MKSCSQIIWWLLPKKSWSLADTLGWLPSQDASDHKDLIVGVRLYFHLYDEWIQKKHFAAKKTSCGLGFRHCIVTRICIPTPGFVGIGGSMPAWPSNRASQNRQGPPAWPTQFVTSRYKVKVSHARSPKRPQLGSSTATMSQPKRFWRNT